MWTATSSQRPSPSRCSTKTIGWRQSAPSARAARSPLLRVKPARHRPVDRSPRRARDAARQRDLSTNPPPVGRFVDNPVDGRASRLVRSHPALRRREGNAVHEGHGETRPRTGWIGEDRTIIARSARRVDAGSGAAPRGTPSQGGVPLERRREPLPTRVLDTRPLPAEYGRTLDAGLTALAI